MFGKEFLLKSQFSQLFTVFGDEFFLKSQFSQFFTMFGEELLLKKTVFTVIYSVW